MTKIKLSKKNFTHNKMIVFEGLLNQNQNIWWVPKISFLKLLTKKPDFADNEFPMTLFPYENK